jgi:hypothetical protein
MATRALIWSRSFAPQRVSFLPRLSVWSEEDEGERKVRVFTNQSPAAGAEAGGKAIGGTSWSRLFVLHLEVRKQYRISCGERGCRTGEITCDFCKVEGQVSSEASERWHRGDALRKKRVERGLTLSEQAGILGVAPRD